MDENSKHVVASNLTVAFMMNGRQTNTTSSMGGIPAVSKSHMDEVWNVYQSFLSRFADSAT